MKKSFGDRAISTIAKKQMVSIFLVHLSVFAVSQELPPPTGDVLGNSKFWQWRQRLRLDPSFLQAKTSREKNSSLKIEKPSQEKLAGSTSWEKLHQLSQGGSVDDIKVIKGKIFMSDATELYVSTDDGATWSLAVTASQLTLKGYTPNTYSWDTSEKIIVSGDSILFNSKLSTDAGLTWKDVVINSTALPTYYFAPTILIFKGKKMYLGTYYDGFFSSSDFGQSFSAMNSGLPSWWYGPDMVEALEFHNGTLVGVTPSGIISWNGSSWALTAGAGLPTTNLNGRTIYFIDGLDFLNSTWIASTNYGVYFSTNSGASWQKFNLPDIKTKAWPLMSHPCVDYKVDVINGKIFATYENNIYISSDGGNSWSHSQLNEKCFITRIVASNSSYFLAASNGIYMSTDGINWSRSNSGFERSSFGPIKATGNNAFISSSYNGVFYSNDLGQNWSTLNQGLNDAYTYLRNVDSKSAIVTTYKPYQFQGGSVISDTATIFKNDIASTQWNVVKTWPVVIPYFTASSGTGNIFAAGSNYVSGHLSQSKGLFASKDNGQTWQQVFSGITHNTLDEDEISFVGVFEDTVYAAASFSGIYKSPDAGATWTSITSNTNGWTFITDWSDPNYDIAISEINLLRKNKNHLYARAYDNMGYSYLYHSANYGKTWSKVDFGSAIPITHPGIISVSFTPSGNVLAACSIGNPDPSLTKSIILLSTDSGKTWSQYGPDFTDSYASYLGDFAVLGNYIYATSFSGVWRTPYTAEENLSLYAKKFHGKKNSEVVVPIQANQFSDIISAQFSVNWDPAVATFVDVESFGLNGMTSNSFGVSEVNSGKLSFSWSEPNLVPQALPDSSALFAIRFALTGKYGAKTLININGQPLSVELIDEKFNTVAVTTSPGKLTIDSVLNISGKIIYLDGNQGVQNVTVNLSGGVLQNSVTDNTGSYSFSAPAGISYDLTPGKANDPNPLNGVDVQDVAAIRRHILGVQSLGSPYQIIAADVNESNSVSTLDIDLITALVLGTNSSFPSNNQWVFTPDEIQFADPMNPFPFPSSSNLPQLDGTVTQSFVGMKLGDANGDRDNTQSTRVSSDAKMVFDITQEKAIDPPGKDIEIPIRVKNFNSLSALQFTIEWDSGKLEFLNSSNQTLSMRFGKKEIANGKLTAMWDEPSGKHQSLADGSELVSLTFNSKNNGTYKDVTVTDAITPIKIFDKDLKSVAHEIRYSSDGEINTGLFSVYPSPFTSTINIDFNSEIEEESNVVILDLLGRVVCNLRINSVAGDNHIALSGSNFESGLYIVSLRSNSKSFKTKVSKN